jgi:hypothetical protein
LYAVISIRLVVVRVSTIVMAVVSPRV